MSLSDVFDDDGLPPRPDLPWYVQPVPRAIENLGLRLVWVVVAINAVGTLFGFYYYGIHPFETPIVQGQFSVEPLVMWPFVPDSPVATLFIAGAFAAWKLGESREWLNALAFFGCIKLGLWTPYVLLTFREEFMAGTALPMYLFLFFSHLAMVLEAFVIYRFADFPVRAVLVALVWYGFNDVVDYFIPLVGRPHHTWIPAEEFTTSGVIHYPLSNPDVVPAHDIAAAGAIVLTLSATFLALATRVKKLEVDGLSGR